MLGPFDEQLIENMIFSPINIMPKPGTKKYRLIHDLAYPYNSESMKLHPWGELVSVVPPHRWSDKHGTRNWCVCQRGKMWHWNGFLSPKYAPLTTFLIRFYFSREVLHQLELAFWCCIQLCDFWEGSICSPMDHHKWDGEDINLSFSGWFSPSRFQQRGCCTFSLWNFMG